MSDKQRLAREILDQLHFYRALGVRWVSVETLSKTKKQKNQISAQASASPSLPAPEADLRVPAVVVSPTEPLDVVRADLGDCRRCKLAPGRRNIVFGSGNPGADLMFVGEAPGADEDEQGLPFVGRAGQLLTKIIEAIDMRREDVYICNILKCRPPGNRNPEPEEIAACEPFLFRQIESVKPRIICALGTFAAQTLLRTRQPISALRGRMIDYRGVKLVATFHPAYLLRNPQEKRKVWEDVQKVRDYLRSLHSSPQASGRDAEK